MLEVLFAVLGVAFILIVLWDAFETVVLPRRVSRRFRIASAFYEYSWLPWFGIGRRLRGSWRETFLGAYGPLSLIMLIVLWASLLVLGFAFLHWSIGNVSDASGSSNDFWSDLYLSASTFFTLGLGDVTPHSTTSRVITVIEASQGFGFLALVISYLPVLYQAFSRREVNVSLLDSRAGSPPSAGEFFLRLGDGRRNERLPELLEEWERWSAEILESHLSYPVLMAYRSQHEHQSWLGALTLMLDVSSLVLCDFHDPETKEAARLTFAMSRHTAVDIAQVFGVDPLENHPDRLPHEDFVRLAEILDRRHLNTADYELQLRELRAQYEPFVAALADGLLMPLPDWLPGTRMDAWQYTAWDDQRTPS